MKSSSLIIIFCSIVLSLFACNECGLADCDGNGGFVRLRLMRNGQNALYGPSAFIEKDSVRTFLLTSFEFETSVGFLDTFQSISIYVDNDVPVIIEINSIRADTISVTTKVTSSDKCCLGYSLTSISRNGQVICEGTCEEIIDMEI